MTPLKMPPYFKNMAVESLIQNCYLLKSYFSKKSQQTTTCMTVKFGFAIDICLGF